MTKRKLKLEDVEGHNLVVMDLDHPSRVSCPITDGTEIEIVVLPDDRGAVIRLKTESPKFGYRHTLEFLNAGGQVLVALDPDQPERAGRVQVSGVAVKAVLREGGKIMKTYTGDDFENLCLGTPGTRPFPDLGDEPKRKVIVGRADSGVHVRIEHYSHSGASLSISTDDAKWLAKELPKALLGAFEMTDEELLGLLRSLLR